MKKKENERKEKKRKSFRFTVARFLPFWRGQKTTLSTKNSNTKNKPTKKGEK